MIEPVLEALVTEIDSVAYPVPDSVATGVDVSAAVVVGTVVVKASVVVETSIVDVATDEVASEVASEVLVTAEPAGVAGPTSGCSPESGVVERPHDAALVDRVPP